MSATGDVGFVRGLATRIARSSSLRVFVLAVPPTFLGPPIQSCLLTWLQHDHAMAWLVLTNPSSLIYGLIFPSVAAVLLSVSVPLMASDASSLRRVFPALLIAIFGADLLMITYGVIAGARSAGFAAISPSVDWYHVLGYTATQLLFDALGAALLALLIVQFPHFCARAQSTSVVRRGYRYSLREILAFHALVYGLALVLIAGFILPLRQEFSMSALVKRLVLSNPGGGGVNAESARHRFFGTVKVSEENPSFAADGFDLGEVVEDENTSRLSLEGPTMSGELKTFALADTLNDPDWMLHLSKGLIRTEPLATVAPSGAIVVDGSRRGAAADPPQLFGRVRFDAAQNFKPDVGPFEFQVWLRLDGSFDVAADSSRRTISVRSTTQDQHSLYVKYIARHSMLALGFGGDSDPAPPAASRYSIWLAPPWGPDSPYQAHREPGDRLGPQDYTLAADGVARVEEGLLLESNTDCCSQESEWPVLSIGASRVSCEKCELQQGKFEAVDLRVAFSGSSSFRMGGGEKTDLTPGDQVQLHNERPFQVLFTGSDTIYVSTVGSLAWLNGNPLSKSAWQAVPFELKNSALISLVAVLGFTSGRIKRFARRLLRDPP